MSLRHELVQLAQADVAMAKRCIHEIGCLDKEIDSQKMVIHSLLSRIADLEEANASRGETKFITKEQWAENFK